MGSLGDALLSSLRTELVPVTERQSPMETTGGGMEETAARTWLGGDSQAPELRHSPVIRDSQGPVIHTVAPDRPGLTWCCGSVTSPRTDKLKF